MNFLGTNFLNGRQRQYLQEVERVEKMETLITSQDVSVPINGSIN